MKRLFFFLFTILLGAPGRPALAASDDTKIIKFFAEGAANVVEKCGARIWPGYNWANLHILVIDHDGRGFALTPKTGVIRDFPKSEVPLSVKDVAFSFFKREQEQWMSLSLKKFDEQIKDARKRGSTGADEIFDIGVHEAFHEFFQGKKQFPDGSRGVNSPIQEQPRIERRMLFENLKRAFLHPEQQRDALSRASYWFRTWKSGFPDELATATDGYEGTASYVGVIAKALVHVGCEASERKLRQRIDSEFDKHFMAFDEVAPLSPDLEGYDIGGVASLLLRFDFPTLNWWPSLSSANTPLQILLDKVPPTSEEADVNIVSAIEKKRETEQNRIDSLIAEPLRAVTTPNTVFVDLPARWHPGSITFSGFYIDSASKLNLIPLSESVEFKSSEGPSKIEIKARSVLFDNFAPPCQEKWGYVFAISEDSITQRETLFKIHSPHLSGIIQGERKKSKSGRNWLCGIH